MWFLDKRIFSRQRNPSLEIQFIFIWSNRISFTLRNSCTQRRRTFQIEAKCSDFVQHGITPVEPSFVPFSCPYFVLKCSVEPVRTTRSPSIHPRNHLDPVKTSRRGNIKKNLQTRITSEIDILLLNLDIKPNECACLELQIEYRNWYCSGYGKNYPDKSLDIRQRIISIILAGIMAWLTWHQLRTQGQDSGYHKMIQEQRKIHFYLFLCDLLSLIFEFANLAAAAVKDKKFFGVWYANSEQRNKKVESKVSKTWKLWQWKQTPLRLRPEWFHCPALVIIARQTVPLFIASCWLDVNGKN